MLVSALTFVNKVSVKTIFLATVPTSCVCLLHCTSIYIYIYLIFFFTEETRIRWVQTQNTAEVLFAKIKELVNSGVYRTEDALHRLLSILSEGWEDSKGKVNAGYENIKHAGDAAYRNVKMEWEETMGKTEDAYDKSGEWVEDVIDKEKEKVGEKVKVMGEKIKGEL